MKKAAFILGSIILCILYHSIVFAGVIHGSIKHRIGEENTSVGKGADIEIKIVVESPTGTPDTKTYTTKTDEFGSYRLNVNEIGECSLTVRYNERTETITIESYQGSSEYNLIFEDKDGKAFLRRE